MPGSLTLSELQSNPRAIYSGYRNDVWNNAITQVGGFLETDINTVVVRFNARHQDRLVRYVATTGGRQAWEATDFSRAKSTADIFDLNFKKNINSTLGSNTLIGGISQNYWNMMEYKLLPIVDHLAPLMPFQNNVTTKSITPNKYIKNVQ